MVKQQLSYIGIIMLLFSYLINAQQTHSDWPILKTYEGKHINEIAMPLGGIGTGTVSLGGRGNLQDWEIMNRGALGYLPAFKFVEPSIANGPFFAIYYKSEGQTGSGRLLEGPVPIRDYYGDWGSEAINSGFPRFDDTSFSAAYPLAQVKFMHQEVPVDVRLEAFNPLVVGDSDKSGIPVAIMRYVLKNNSDSVVETSIVGMVPNYIGADGWSGEPNKNRNEYRNSKQLKGLYMYSEGVNKKDANWGTMALTTTSKEGVTYRTSWAKIGWNWTFREFWDDFTEDGELIDHPEENFNVNKINQQDTDVIYDIKNKRIKTPPATLAVKQTLQPGETKEVTFILSWHFPNRYGWDLGNRFSSFGDGIVGNYYTTQYTDAWDVAENTSMQLETLEDETVTFVKSLVESDIPLVLKEAGLSNLNNLRSQTVFRTRDGLPFGWEGTGSLYGTVSGGSPATAGWGLGSCTHVWNYESTTPFLFGELAMKFREVEFLHAVNEDGSQCHRVGLPIDEKGKMFKRWAADGQMGTLIKIYRDWQLSGDDSKLREMWPNIKKVMSFAWTGIWDTNKDGVMEGSQHNTMDVDYNGPNPQMAGWYLGALKASEKMAHYLGDKAFAKECKILFNKGRKWVDANLFNGEYYEQLIPEGLSKTAQIGKGCLVDQLVGQYLAHTAGLGYVLDKNHVSTTLKSIMKYNYVDNFDEHFNTFRSFALADESGLIMASYPLGGLLDEPFPYYTEVMTGFEYSTGAHMIYEGQVEAGIKVFENIRDRYDGFKRNPFNEGEFGHRYARAMAAWAGILAYTGFQYSAVDMSMSFNQKNGSYFWSNGYLYGKIEISGTYKKTIKITPKNGNLTLKLFKLNDFGNINFKKSKTFEKGKSTEFIVVKN